MRLMAFSMTTAQVRARTKTVTRRCGWWKAAPGQVVMAVEKAQGLKAGEHPVRIGAIRFLSVRREPLMRITAADVVLEGFPDGNVQTFIRMFKKANGCDVRDPVNRIAFEYMNLVTRRADDEPAGRRMVAIDRLDLIEIAPIVDMFHFDRGETLWMPEYSARVIAWDPALRERFVIDPPLAGAEVW